MAVMISVRWRATSSSCMASPTPGRAGTPWSRRSGNAIARSRPTSAATERASELEPVALDAVLDDLAGLAPQRFTLVGYSMGGRIALHAALALGDRIDRLVLIGASPGLADPSERAARRAADEELAGEIERLDIEEFAGRWAQTPVLAGQPPEVLAVVHADRLRNRPAGLARALRGLGTGALPSLWDRLGEITAAGDARGRRADDPKFTEIATRMASGLRRGDGERRARTPDTPCTWRRRRGWRR